MFVDDAASDSVTDEDDTIEAGTAYKRGFHGFHLAGGRDFAQFADSFLQNDIRVAKGIVGFVHAACFVGAAGVDDSVTPFM